MKKISVVVDVNWFVSACINAKSREKLELLLLSNVIVFLICKELFDEFDEVINRPKFRKLTSPENIENFKKIVAEKSIVVKNLKIKKQVRDIKDDYIVALSLKGNADYIITGDDDLLVLKKIKNTVIIKLTDFIDKYKKQPLNELK